MTLAHECSYAYYELHARVRNGKTAKGKPSAIYEVPILLSFTLKEPLAVMFTWLAEQKSFTAQDVLVLWEQEWNAWRGLILADEGISYHSIRQSALARITKIMTKLSGERSQFHVAKGPFYEVTHKVERYQFGIRFPSIPYLQDSRPYWARDVISILYVAPTIPVLKLEYLRYYLPFTIYLKAAMKIAYAQHSNNTKLRVIWVDTVSNCLYEGLSLGRLYGRYAENYQNRYLMYLYKTILNAQYFRHTGQHCERCPMRPYCYSDAEYFIEL